MSCDCAQGYNQPAVNRSPCGCQRGYSGPRPYSLGWLAPPVVTRGSGLGRPYGMAYSLGGPPAPTFLGRLMGDLIPQGLGPVDPGAQYQFGFNIPLTGTCETDATSIAGWLEQDGLSYDTQSDNIGGYIRPFISIQGYTMTAWNSGTDLANAIYNSIAGRNCSIDQTSIQFRVQTSGQQQLTGTPQTPAAAATPAGVTAACPPGYVDKGWFSVNCQPVGTQGSAGIDLTSLGLGVLSGTTVALVVGVGLLFVLARR